LEYFDIVVEGFLALPKDAQLDLDQEIAQAT